MAEASDQVKKQAAVLPVAKVTLRTDKNSLCLSPALMQKLRSRLKRVMKKHQTATAVTG
ncbi:hypothetical protein [Rheinheimera soli]|uniref:hypothetical protein n=1 Tax=Rheinheimera soli TaxID=443616 RepID=UPI001E2F6DB1|nr:hypothetical protein [Rheinheimera soli]